MASSNHLVIVCGHGIWLGGPQHGHDEAEWLIEAYKAGETPTFIEHIKAGLRVLGDDERALIVFSGGPTRPETKLSEARSYANLAAANNYFGYLKEAPKEKESSSSHPLSPIPLHPRVLVDEQALDSYYNILFSILVFWRTTGRWPDHLTIVSHAFKQHRLVDGHCGPDAIDFPLARVSFIGINPPNLPPGFGLTTAPAPDAPPPTTITTSDKAKAMEGAHAVVDQWVVDPHGIGENLAGKRRARNPWDVNQHLFTSDEERQRSGLPTRMVGTGMEALADGQRPWR